MSRETVGLLVVNLGTPAAPTPEAVGPYLREFLMDPYVLRLPKALRWFLVNVLIVPRRAKDSAKLYQNIWTAAGSPLLVNSRAFVDALRPKLPDGVTVALAMRYGEPSLRKGLAALLAAKPDRLVIFPMYPQYALSSTETCLEQCQRELAALGAPASLPVEYVPEFFDAEGFIGPLGESVRRHVAETAPDHVLFSFHGLPESHVKLTDPGRHCFTRPDCCAEFRAKAPHCYRAQSYWTAHEAARRAGLAPERYSVAFQSRLGREPWLTPYTDVVVAELAKKGVKRLAVACPAFTADCLETLEEISFRAQEIFAEAGGETVTLIPCLNADPAWVDGAAAIFARGPRRPLAQRPGLAGFGA